MEKIESWEEINDLSKNEFENVTDNCLLRYPALNQRDKVKIEMNRRLKNEIKRFNESSSKQSSKMFWLTISMGIVALLQLVVVIIQMIYSN